MNLRNADAGAKAKAKSLRRHMNRSERLLWSRLKASALGYAFRRQFPLGPYVLDFYCSEALLCVELDGFTHTRSVVRDAARDQALEALGIATLRIATGRLWRELDECVAEVQFACIQRSEALGGGPDE